MISVNYGKFKVSNKTILLNNEISYTDFINEIQTINSSVKVYLDKKEITSGNIEEGMTLKVISDKYGIIEEYKITSEHIDVSKLNIDENIKISDVMKLANYVLNGKF